MTTFPSPLEQWTKLFQEAERLLSEVVERIAQRESVPASLPVELRQRTAEIRRKVSIVQTKMGLMQEELSKLSSKQNISLKEMRKLAEKFSALELRVNKVAAPFSMKNSSNRNDLLGPSDSRGATVVDVSSLANMEDREIIELQRDVMKQQDESLDRLEETIVSTKHIALAINEELDLHTRLIDDLDEGVEDTSYQLNRAQRKLKSLNTRMIKGGSCTCVLLSLIAVVICVVMIWALIVF
ncbi:syntaxin-52-like [Lolium rigidum]|uniref:syntaxin-52-like n=1 Tax=Lolium rigidum TaxID=89674 RepID=UPI001F5D24CA|nr:syntaxin-52-like [Lolium rigidum]